MINSQGLLTVNIDWEYSFRMNIRLRAVHMDENDGILLIKEEKNKKKLLT
jgi:hypothetical protein